MGMVNSAVGGHRARASASSHAHPQPPRAPRGLTLTPLLMLIVLSVSVTAAQAAGAPSIDGVSASNITEHNATLEAQINPNGLETAYQFQIDTNGNYNYTKSVCPLGECEAISVGEPLPAGLVEPEAEHIPAGSGDQPASLDLANIGATLQPGTMYHYRVLASNGSGPMVQGLDQTFTTSSSAATPSQCTGSECQRVPPVPPTFVMPPSVTFEGLGNYTATEQPVNEGLVNTGAKPKAKAKKCAKGKKLSHNKCVAKSKRKNSVKRK